MKKNFFVIAVLMIVTVALSSCSKEDDYEFGGLMVDKQEQLEKDVPNQELETSIIEQDSVASCE